MSKPNTTTQASKASERPPTAPIDARQGVSAATPPTARKHPPRQSPDLALSLIDERVLDHLVDELVLEGLNVGGIDALALIDERVLDGLNVGGADALSKAERG